MSTPSFPTERGLAAVCFVLGRLRLAAARGTGRVDRCGTRRNVAFDGRRAWDDQPGQNLHRAEAMRSPARMQPTSAVGTLCPPADPMAAAAEYLGGQAAFPGSESGAGYGRAMPSLAFDPLGVRATRHDLDIAERGNAASPQALAQLSPSELWSYTTRWDTIRNTSSIGPPSSSKGVRSQCRQGVGFSCRLTSSA